MVLLPRKRNSGHHGRNRDETDAGNSGLASGGLTPPVEAEADEKREIHGAKNHGGDEERLQFRVLFPEHCCWNKNEVGEEDHGEGDESLAQGELAATHSSTHHEEVPHDLKDLEHFPSCCPPARTKLGRFTSRGVNWVGNESRRLGSIGSGRYVLRFEP